VALVRLGHSEVAKLVELLSDWCEGWCWGALAENGDSTYLLSDWLWGLCALSLADPAEHHSTPTW